MTDSWLAIGHRLDGVVLSGVIALMASYLALDIASRVHDVAGRAVRGLWLAAGAMALGTGVWAMHFVGMAAAQLPFLAFYDHVVTGLSWIAAVAVAGALLLAASRASLRLPVVAAVAVAGGIGAAGMHHLGMTALPLAPAARFQPLWIVVSAAIAVAGIGALLVAMPAFLRLPPGARWRRQVGLAALLGGALVAMHYVAVHGTQVAPGAFCTTREGLDANELGDTTGVVTMLLLAFTLAVTTLQRWSDDHAARMRTSLGHAREELHFATFNDALTGLPNRLTVQDRLRQAELRAARTGGGVAVALIDLDAFRLVNGAYGQGGGDAVLRAVAERMARCLADGDTLARTGADQFLVLFDDVREPAQVHAAVEACLAAVREPIAVGGRTCLVTASAGIAVRDARADAPSLVAQADAALAAAKRAGGNLACAAAGGADAEAREQADLVQDLRLATQRGELCLLYQPKVHARSRMVTGVEALVRWRHPVRGLVGPDVFIPLAERFGVIGEIGRWVIGEACRQMVAWSREGLRMRVAVNLSVQQLREPGFPAALGATIARHGVDPSLLTCEITESIAMDHPERLLGVFRELRAVGVLLSIDDFGTGYSSLGVLRQFPVSQLKIDRGFVRDLASSEDARAVVGAIVQLAHALRLEVVAEGVETEAQHAVLIALDVDKMQGWLFAKPLAADALSAWAAERDEPVERLGFRPSIFAAEAAGI
jgi:diguanylate cyclase (GGDEF)-like protein